MNRPKSLPHRLAYKRPRAQLEALMDLVALIEAGSLDEGDCLLWQGRRSSGGVPRYNDMSLRRMVYEARFGPLPSGFLASTNCGRPECLHHLCKKTKSQVLTDTYASSDLALRRSVTSTRVSRARAKLDIQKAREIRSSTETIDVLAARFNVDRTLCHAIRRGTAWKEVSPFAGLGARGAGQGVSA